MQLNESLNNDRGLSIKDLLFVIKKNIVMILIVTLLFTVAGAVYGLGFKPVSYTASTTALVDNNNSGGSNEYQSYLISTNLMNTFKDFIVSDLVMKDVVNSLQAKDAELYKNISLSKLKKNTTVSVATNNSLIIRISYKSTNMDEAIEIVNQIATSTTKLANEKDGENYKHKVLAESFVIMDQATDENVNRSRGASTIIAICFIIGFVLSFLVALIKHLANDTYTSKEEFEETFRISVLTLLPDFVEIESKNGGKK